MTIFYQDNFDADTVGAIAPGWVNETGTWTVKAVDPISGANTFSPADYSSAGSGAFVNYTGGSAVADSEFTVSFKVPVSPAGGNFQEFGAALRTSGATGYLVNVGYDAGGQLSLQIFKKQSASSFSTTSSIVFSGITPAVGDVVTFSIRCVGTTIEGRIWTNATGRPSAPLVTVTDGAYASGKVGLYYAAVGTANSPIGVDNLSWSDGTATAVIASPTTTNSAIGSASPTITITHDGQTSGADTITPSDGGAGGTFSPSGSQSVTGTSTVGWTYTPAGSTGSRTLTFSSSLGLTAATVAFTATGSAVTTISRTTGGLTFSPSTWFDDGTAMVAVNTGAYVKFNFTGTSIKLNTEALAAMSAYPLVRCFIDNQKYDITLSTATQFLIASGLAAGAHSFELHYRASLYSAGSWWNAVNALKITGFELDSGATVSAPTIRSKVMFAFGDSLTQGYFVNGTSSPANDDSLATYVPNIAKALDAEYAQVGWGGTNYAGAGVSDVPAFNTSYAFVAAGHSRLTSGQFTRQPDYISVMLGTNGSTAQSDVATAITNLRAAAPNAVIFIIVPGGGFARAAETAAVAAASDPKVFLIDAGATYQYASGTANAYSADGTHYAVIYYALLGAKWVQQIDQKLGGAAAGTYPTAAQVLTGITFGPTNNLTGNVTLPTVGNVVSGVTYGSNGSMTGTYASSGGGGGGGTYPTASQVLAGVTFGAGLTGNVTLPTFDQVEAGVTFGAAGAITGTLVTGGGSGGASPTDLWNHPLIDGVTAGDLLNRLAIKAVGESTGLGTLTQRRFALDNSGKVRLTEVVDPKGNVLTSVFDGS